MPEPTGQSTEIEPRKERPWQLGGWGGLCIGEQSFVIESCSIVACGSFACFWQASRERRGNEKTNLPRCYLIRTDTVSGAFDSTDPEGGFDATWRIEYEVEQGSD